MFNLFEHTEVNLGRAGWAFVLTFLGSTAASFASASAGFDPGLGLIVYLAGSLAIAWFMSRAALVQGRSPVLYGLGGLVPPLSLLAFLRLYTRDQDARLASKFGAGPEA